MPPSNAVRAGRAYVEVFADDSKLVRGLRLAKRRLNKFGRDIVQMGRRLTATAAIFAAPLALVTRIFAEFDDQMRVVQAVSGATGKEFDDLSAKARKLGRTTSFTATQVAGAMAELGRSNFNVEQIDVAIAGILSLARATSTELPLATKIAVGVLRGFNMDVMEMSRVTDILAKTSNSSALVLEDLGESLKMAASWASEGGASLEATAASIGLLANNSIRGTMAGTQLARAYKNLTKKSFAPKLKELSVDVADASGNMRSLVDILEEIREKTKGRGNVYKLGLFEEIFGRGGAAALKLSSGATTLDELLSKLKQSQGAAKKAADLMDAGIGGALRFMFSAINDVAIGVGKSLEKMFIRWADKIKNVANWIVVLVEKNAELFETIAKIVVVVGAAGAALLAIGVAIQLVAFTIGAIATAFVAFGSVLGVVASAIGLLGTALVAIGPGGLLAITILAKFSTILFNVGKITASVTKWMGDKFKLLKDIAIKSFQGIGDALAAGDIKLAAEVLWKSLELVFAIGINDIKLLWVNFQNWITQKMINVWSGIQAIWADSTLVVTKTWSSFIGALSSGWTIWVSWYKRSVESWANWIAKRMLEVRGLTDDTFDVAAAKKHADAQSAARFSQIKRETNAKLSDIELTHIEEVKAAKAAHADKMEAIAKEHMLRSDLLDKDSANRKKKLQEELATATKAWQAALAKAKAARDGLKGDGDDDTEPPWVGKIKDIIGGMAATQGVIGGSSRGTFGTQFIKQILGGNSNSMEQKQLDAAEKTAKNTDTLVRGAADGGLTFA